jgi:hypothetical protein
MVEAVRRGDTALLAPTIREGADLEEYRLGIASMMESAQYGPLRSIEAIGTVPFAFPRGSRITVLAFRYARGTDFIRFGWSKEQDRVINIGEGSPLLAETPLRADSRGGLVGWSIVSGRALHLSLSEEGGEVAAIALERPDGSRTLAERPA